MGSRHTTAATSVEVHNIAMGRDARPWPFSTPLDARLAHIQPPVTIGEYRR
jgi:hypothetical protein